MDEPTGVVKVSPIAAPGLGGEDRGFDPKAKEIHDYGHTMADQIHDYQQRLGDQAKTHEIVAMVSVPYERFESKEYNERLEKKLIDSTEAALKEAGIENVKVVAAENPTMTFGQMSEIANEDNWKEIQKQLAGDYKELKKAKSYEKFEDALKKQDDDQALYVTKPSAIKDETFAAAYSEMRAGTIGTADMFEGNDKEGWRVKKGVETESQNP